MAKSDLNHLQEHINTEARFWVRDGICGLRYIPAEAAFYVQFQDGSVERVRTAFVRQTFHEDVVAKVVEHGRLKGFVPVDKDNQCTRRLEEVLNEEPATENSKEVTLVPHQENANKYKILSLKYCLPEGSWRIQIRRVDADDQMRPREREAAERNLIALFGKDQIEEIKKRCLRQQQEEGRRLGLAAHLIQRQDCLLDGSSGRSECHLPGGHPTG